MSTPLTGLSVVVWSSVTKSLALTGLLFQQNETIRIVTILNDREFNLISIIILLSI
jgi:hypothetical protein